MALVQSPSTGRAALSISLKVQYSSIPLAVARSGETYTSRSSTRIKIWQSLGRSPFHRRVAAFVRPATWVYPNQHCVEKAGLIRRAGTVVCDLRDFIGGDLLGFDLDQWEKDVEDHKALALYTPHEGGYEGRYATRLRIRGYHFLDLTARGLGDVEAYLSKIHGVRPAHLGKQKIVRWYFPPEVDYRLSLLPENSKGLVLWLMEAKVLSKSELQYLALLPTLQPRVKVIAECGTWRKVRWKPLREIAGLDVPSSTN